MTTESGSRLQSIPGIGPAVARNLVRLGIQSPEELKGMNPEALYLQLCSLKNRKVGLCYLYVFRCAVYYMSTAEYDPRLLKWWNWKD